MTGLLVLGACSDSDDGGDAGPASTIATTNADTRGPTAVVEAGDTLSGIAASYGLTLDELIEANGWSDGADHAIFPGDEVQLPAGASPVATTNRPTTAAPSPSDDRPTTTDASATTEAQDEVDYRPLDGNGSPDFGDETDPVSTPLPDGIYWAWDANLSGDGGSVDFTLSQVFFGDACREVFGTSPEACASDIGSDESTLASGVARDRERHGERHVHGPEHVEFTFYRVPTTELARLLAGDAPSPGAPDGSDVDRQPVRRHGSRWRRCRSRSGLRLVDVAISRAGTRSCQIT